MIAVEAPQHALKKHTLLGRFSRRDRDDALPSAHYDAMSAPLPHSPRKLLRRKSPQTSVDLGLPTPPDSPRNSAEEEVKVDEVQKIDEVKVDEIKIDEVKIGTAQPRFLPAIVHRVELPQSIPRVKVSIPTGPRHQADTPPPSPPSSPSPLIRLRVRSDAMATMQFKPHPQIRPWNVFLPPSQVFSLYLGYLPREWADQWYVYSEGPDVTGKLKVHFHRSWTGEKIAQLFIVMDVKGEGAGKIVGIKWTGGPEANYMNEKDAKYMIRTTCRGTLGVNLEEGD